MSKRKKKQKVFVKAKSGITVPETIGFFEMGAVIFLAVVGGVMCGFAIAMAMMIWS